MDFLKIPEVATVVWSLMGVAMGMLGLWLFDLSAPAFSIKQELAEKNPAIGIVMAGLMFSIGLIVYNSMLQNDSLLKAIEYSFIGIFLNIALYHVVSFMLPGWKLSKEIDEHNQGAGWFVFGLFILIGQCISGAIS